MAVFTILDADGFMIFGSFHYFWTLTFFLSVFTILDLDRFIIFGLFYHFGTPTVFIIFARFDHFWTLIDLLFLAVFTIFGA